MTSPAKSQSYMRHRTALAALVAAVILAAIAFSSGKVSSQGPETRRDLERVFRQHDRLSLDAGQIARQVKQTRSLTLTTSRGTFEMTLEPHEIRAPGYRAEAWGDKGVTVLERGPVRTYKGTVKGQPAAQARFTIDEQTVEGLIITPSELFFIEPAKHYSGTAAKTDFVFYSELDVKEPTGECGNTMAEMVAQQSANVSNQTSSKGPQPEALFGPALEIGIAAEADFEYFQALGGETPAANRIVDIMNQVEGIYNAQLGLQFQLLHTRVWTTANDPYTSPTPPAEINSATALNQFTDYYNGAGNAPPQAATRDIAHLFTGRNLSGSTIGIAWQPGLSCSSIQSGYGISMNLEVGNRAGLTAHEIGHNLSASHVTSAQGTDCGDPGTSSTSIMNPSISATTDFCQFSKDEITRHAIAMRNCLTPISSVCVSISPASQDIPASGGSGNIIVDAVGGCSWGVAEGESWLSANPQGGTGIGAVAYTVGANSCGPRTALISVGGQIHTVNQAGNPTYLTDASTAIPIVPGQTINGELVAPDCPTGIVDDGDDPETIRVNAFMDRYKFNGMAGQKIRIEMNATVPPPTGVDTYLYLYGPDGNQVQPNGENDDIALGTQTNSRIPCIGFNPGPCPVSFLTLPQTGTYIIIATSFLSGDSGTYSLTLTSEPLLLTAQVTDSVGTAAALNSVTFQRTSNATHTAFRIFDPFNFSADQTTRLILFTSDLGLPSQLNPSATGPNALLVTAGGQDLLVENVGPFSFPGLNGSYVVVALKRRDGQPLAGVPGNFAFTVTRGVDPLNGNAPLVSNVATITIAP